MEVHRSYEDDRLDATELRLGLPGTAARDKGSRGNKRVLAEDDKCLTNTRNESKAQVVGWPPVRSYRRNNVNLKKVEGEDKSGVYVKVSMDGAPYLRKIDIKVYKGYEDLRENLEVMFNGFSTGEHVITYEDKDGDWMMVGDVPWEMFISACKRLRIMKGTEARGVGSSP